MIHIYCGDGKGKTTAAVGLAVRMAGFGGRVLLGQFFKDGSSHEISVLKAIPGVTVRHCKTIPGRYIRLNPEQREQVRQDYTAYLLGLLEDSRDYDLLVLDEVISACCHGTVPEETLCAFLSKAPESLEIILTGRNPSQALQAHADYITEMKKQKHPFDAGISAREGIEY